MSNLLRNDLMWMGIIIALVITVAVMSARSDVRAATSAKVTCGEPVDAGVWMITRCEGDWGEVCFLSSSGFLACKFD